jgi:hypothetical protein
MRAATSRCESCNFRMLYHADNMEKASVLCCGAEWHKGAAELGCEGFKLKENK